MAHASFYSIVPSLTVVSPNGPRAAVVRALVDRDQRGGMLGGEGGGLALAAVELRLLLSPAHAHELRLIKNISRAFRLPSHLYFFRDLPCYHRLVKHPRQPQR